MKKISFKKKLVILESLLIFKVVEKVEFMEGF